MHHVNRHKLYDNSNWLQKEQQDWSHHEGPLRHNSALFAVPPVFAEQGALGGHNIAHSPRVPSFTESDLSGRKPSYIPGSYERSNGESDNDSICQTSEECGMNSSGAHKLKPIPPPRTHKSRPRKNPPGSTDANFRSNLMYRTKYLPDGRCYIVTDLQNEFVPVGEM